MKLRLVAAALCGTALVGCGRSGDEMEVAAVHGKVLLDGRPLTSGVVTAWPAAGRAACGAIQADGSFQLTTYSAGDGAQLGTHPVTVTRAAPVGERALTLAELTRIPVRYTNPEASGLTITVTADQSNTPVIELRSK